MTTDQILVAKWKKNVIEHVDLRFPNDDELHNACQTILNDCDQSMNREELIARAASSIGRGIETGDDEVHFSSGGFFPVNV